MWNPRTVLVLAPHTDDYEIGAGGYIHRLISGGATLHAMAFSTAAESLPAGLPPDTLVHECREAARRLGIPAGNLEILNFPVRRFPEHRQPILELLVAARRRIAPDLVLVHATTDVHQDHQVITQEAIRAFKGTTILGYELPWNDLRFSTQCMVQLSEENLQAKLHALEAYASQMHRAYAKADVPTGLARVRGVSVGFELAEAFEVIRWIQPSD